MPNPQSSVPDPDEAISFEFYLITNNAHVQDMISITEKRHGKPTASHIITKKLLETIKDIAFALSTQHTDKILKARFGDPLPNPLPDAAKAKVVRTAEKSIMALLLGFNKETLLAVTGNNLPFHRLVFNNRVENNIGLSVTDPLEFIKTVNREYSQYFATFVDLENALPPTTMEDKPARSPRLVIRKQMVRQHLTPDFSFSIACGNHGFSTTTSMSEYNAMTNITAPLGETQANPENASKYLLAAMLRLHWNNTLNEALAPKHRDKLKHILTNRLANADDEPWQFILHVTRDVERMLTVLQKLPSDSVQIDDTRPPANGIKQIKITVDNEQFETNLPTTEYPLLWSIANKVCRTRGHLVDRFDDTEKLIVAALLKCDKNIARIIAIDHRDELEEIIDNNLTAMRGDPTNFNATMFVHGVANEVNEYLEILPPPSNSISIRVETGEKVSGKKQPNIYTVTINGEETKHLLHSKQYKTITDKVDGIIAANKSDVAENPTMARNSLVALMLVLYDDDEIDIIHLNGVIMRNIHDACHDPKRFIDNVVAELKTEPTIEQPPASTDKKTKPSPTTTVNLPLHNLNHPRFKIEDFGRN